MSRSVLVIEDYPDLRSAIVEVLSQNDCVCDCADSNAAIAKLRVKNYAAILIGPRLSLTTDPVWQFLVANQPAELGRVVVMSDPELEDADDGARCHVLPKPFSREELLAQVKAAL